ncbi:MAG: amino acid adenylation domain-containing protein, partial [Alphaproteobacteria bacterium]|nr:amino acid adenylation domain-containing protein [Alphaproteobacteria bacterium]
MHNLAQNIREEKTNVVALYPLSPMQGGFLFQNLYAPDSDAYFIQMVFELEGKLEVKALKQAWSRLLDRHESLRASFMWEDLEEPIQVIHRRVDLPWYEENWQGLSTEEQSQHLKAYIKKDRGKGFDFTQAPLMRWGLFKYSDHKYYLVWSYHHILSDGWSGPIILDEIRSIYNSLVQGKNINLPSQRSYGDYIAWLSGQDQEKAETYWKQVLNGFTPTKLGTETIKEIKVQSYGECRFTLEREHSQQLLDYASSLGVTPNTVLQTLWGIILSAYTGQNDVVFGVIVSGRQIDLSGIESMVGIFINNLPLRIKLQGFESVEDLIKTTQNQMIGMQEHAYIPLWKIQSQQKEGGSGLFDSTYVYQNYPIQSDTNQDSELTINFIKGIEKAEYTLGITLSYETCLSARINYREDYFAQSFIEQLLKHYEQLILSVVQNPLQKVGELTFLQPEEQKLLDSWNETYHDYPRDQTLSELFEASVEKVPDAIALVYEDQQISYRALNERANQLAHYFQSLGVEAEVPVALAIDRSVEMITGILGILKAGGVYVPLEVSYPEDRLGYMLEDSGAPFIVTRSTEVKKLPISHQIVINLDEIEQILNGQPTSLPEQKVCPENLAYIIYTSGSTGRPKGVAVSQLNVVHLALAQQESFSYRADTRTLQFASISFDASISELCCTFAQGSTLIMCNNRDIIEVERVILREQINLMTVPPSVLKNMFSITNVDSLRSIVVAGEAPDFNHIREYKKGGKNVINAYGPTETTVCASLGYIDSLIHIGRPIWNTQIYIMDENLNRVAIGLEGEIYIGGVGLARGYLNKPALTAEKFVPNPFAIGSRLYKTGDLGRYLSDGNIEFLGRIDHQLKLRGFRIELGEIEGTIEVSDKVQQAVVLCREDTPGQKRLVAYVVPRHKEHNGLLESLQSLCQSRLPDYMQPSQWVLLDSLPLTPNGKIDRKALPAPEGREGLGVYKAPEGLIEERLAEIWSELLGIKISRTDDFFRLGGHSLLATQMVSRLREVLKREVPLKAVFEHSVLLELAQYLEQSHLQEAILPAISPISHETPQVLSFAQQRLWFIEQLLPDTSLYHNSMSFRILGKLNVEALRQALDAIVARHEILRTVIINSEGVALQKVLPEATSFSLEENNRDIETFIKKPFVFDQEPLCKGLLLHNKEQESVLVLVFHHIVIDDWSMGIFFKELNTFYKAYSEKRALTLPPLPVQYIDYSVWQRSWLQGEILEKQLNYWQTQLKGVSSLELPTDYPRPKELSYQGGFVYKKLSKELLDQLHLFSQARGVTLFMSLLASLQSFLSRYCNQTDVAVGTPITNRRSSEIEGLIGFFVNTLVLRSQFEDNPTFETLMKRVEQNTLSAYDHQDVPFEQLVEYLQVSRELNRNPLFQVMFNLQHEGDSLQLGDLEIHSEETPEYLSRFDLLINAFASSKGLYLKIDYAKDLFSQDRIEKFADYYETFLRSLLKDPSQRLSEVPLLDEQEQQQLLLWNKTEQEYPRDKNIPQLFEEQVEKVPYNVAVVYDDQELTYQELNERANQLSHYLRKKGVGPDKLVAIAFERSVEMIVGILGILKAGGAYVPLDPSYPSDRLQFMLEDTQASVLITQNSLKPLFKDYSGILIVLDDGQDQQRIQLEAKTNSLSQTLPHHLAYVIYTSGSTGQPKGVLVEHKQVAGFCSKNNYLEINSQTTTFSFSNYVFDGSVFDIFSTLLNSGRLVLTHKDDLLNAEKLEQFLLEYSVNVAFITTALFVYYAKLRINNPLRHIEKLLFGGEKISLEDLEIFLENHGAHSLIHVYGPTENIVFSTYCYIDSKNKLHAPIGKRLGDKTVYILDKEMQLAPIGVNGELYIGGNGLARGYLNRPKLTAEKFAPNPFASREEVRENKNLRLYRTGDLARYLPDGNIEFIGRVDDQVKIRGFRIELGEIETQLMQYTEVEQAVVLVKEEVGHKQLIAYVVPKKEIYSPLNQGLPIDIPHILDGKDIFVLEENLRNYLTSNVPDYMIPAFFIFINKISLTPNGKIDKKALPSPDLVIRQTKEEYVRPQTLLQQQLADIWSQVLRIEKIGIDDNFFRIGGDSIISIQLVAKARKQGIYFSVRDVFNYPTIGSLSLIAKSQESILTLKPDQSSIEGHIPLTPIQYWFFDLQFSNIHHYNQAKLLEVKEINADLLRRSFEFLINHHDALRCRYNRNERGEWKQINLPKENINLVWKIVDLGHFGREEQKLRIEKEANTLQQTLNIEKGPLIKIILFDCGKDPAKLLIVIHHLIIDGVSWRILLEDLEQVYSALQENRIPQLIKTHSLQQWSYALENYATLDDFKSEIAYWQDVENTVQLLPIDFDNGQINKLNTITVSLNAEETKALLQIAPKAYRTQINDLLLTALILAIGDWTQNYNISLSLEGHGREDIISEIDLSRTLGWFTSIFPVNLSIEDSENLGKAIKSIKETLRHIPHKGIGYGIAKYLSKNCFNVNKMQPSLSFNYLGQWDNSLSLQGKFNFASESSGNEIAEGNLSPYLLSVNGEVKEGTLYFNWSYSKNHYFLKTIDRISHNFIQRLTQIINHCCQDNLFGYTSSDFGLVKISQKVLDDR